jgi:ATP-binding cassette subfamily B protein
MTIAPAHLQRLRLLRPFAWRLSAGLLCMMLTVLAQLAYPQALSYFIDHLRSQSATADWQLPLALAALLLLTVQAAAATLRYYLFDSAGHLIVARIRQQLHAVLIGQEIAFFDRHHAGELSSRLSADVETLHETLTMGVALSLRSVCVLVGAIVLLLTISHLLSAVLLLCLPASLWLGKRAGRDYRIRAAEKQDSLAECAKVAHEHFSHVRVVHAFGQQHTVQRRYGAAIGRALSISLDTSRLIALYRGAGSVVLYLALLVTLWLGAHLIGQGKLSVGDLAAFVLYGSMVTDSAGAISDFWAAWMRALGATDRIFKLIGGVESAAPPPATPMPLAGKIELRGVSFRYPERPQVLALNDINLTIAAGEKVAMVGASGAGKSTIASLILGFYAPERGALLFDGRPVTLDQRAALRANMAIVEQEPSLLSGSIADNIAFAVPERTVTREEIVASAKLAYADDFISAFPQGYDTLVGERGVQLSGGQKQRIAIARALLRDPRILLLDEATSALDAASERQVQQALERLMAGRTTLIIAHRFSTIVHADRVLVLEGGRLVQQGRHQELLDEAEGLYSRLIRDQLHTPAPA